ncbi:Wadjet anti-phage system protein JetD domain-containing protein [Undibacterium sp. Tian12W]|uniref:Wadjet anti-phage system protein JetD domain-containing protein n=1 Tax=Undibacterium sp. Tian12W TaxID=3413054 RepID=UPI003BF294F4
MNWTGSIELKAQLQRLWERGDLLRMQLEPELHFPLRLSLKAPTSSDISDRFDAVRKWITELASLPHIRLEWREVRHRIHGLQRLPDQVWINSLEAALAITGKKREAARFQLLFDETLNKRQVLQSWLKKRPMQALDLHDRWPQLLAIIAWLCEHPRPAIYLRQVDITGIHSKFIEANRAVLSELLDLALPLDAIDERYTGIGQFASRYGFLDKPLRLRFRVLDQSMQILAGISHPDIMLDADSFSRLDLSGKTVFITENEINFLAFPKVANAIVIFGSGYGWDALASAQWLNSCAIYYWGDIDTHGFAILNQLRHHFQHVTSFLMDRESLLRHEIHWGEEANQVTHAMNCLNAEEQTLFEDLREQRLGKNLRLEQERIQFEYVMNEVLRLTNATRLLNSD